MVSDPQGRLTDDGTRPETSSRLAPEEVAEAGSQQNASDTDWLSMTMADPAFFLKDSGSE